MGPAEPEPEPGLEPEPELGSGPGPASPARRLLRLLHPQRRRCTVVVTLLVASAIAEVIVPYFTGRVTDRLAGATDVTGTIWVMVLLALGSAGTEFLSDLLYGGTVTRAHAGLQRAVFAAILRQDVAFFEATGAGIVTSQVTGDAEAAGAALAQELGLLLWYGARGGCLVAAMAAVSPRLALVTGLALPLVVALPQATKNFRQRLARQVQDALAGANAVALETFGAVGTVRSFANEAGAAGRYRDRLRACQRLQEREAGACAASLCTSQLLGLALRIGILFYGGHLVTEGLISTGVLVTFLLYHTQFTEALEVLLSRYSEVRKAVGASEKLFEYLERVPRVAPSGTLAPRDLRGHLQLRDVWFSYPGREEPVLKGVSLELHPGEVLALVGAAGSGKSTVVALLQRLREPERGHLLLDGHPLRRYSLAYLRAQVVAVRQEATLFARSLHDNVALGAPGRSRREVEAAARRAGAHSFIARLHRGYDTDAGELGGLLSGGQRQAVAIARALLRDPRVLVLDDPTSALDVEMQLQVQRALAASGRAVLVATARPALAEAADRVALLQGGRVAELGPPGHLLRQRGPFWSFVQAAGGDPAAGTQGQ
ncbi:antigen peptide transporter 1 [Eudromia elegans]